MRLPLHRVTAAVYFPVARGGELLLRPGEAKPVPPFVARR